MELIRTRELFDPELDSLLDQQYQCEAVEVLDDVRTYESRMTSHIVLWKE
jgi:hypothetical protein